MKTTTANYSGNLEVGVFNNSTDLGVVGRATTRRGALRVGKKAASASLPTSSGKYTGYNYTIRIYDLDNDRQEIESVRI